MVSVESFRLSDAALIHLELHAPGWRWLRLVSYNTWPTLAYMVALWQVSYHFPPPSGLLSESHLGIIYIREVQIWGKMKRWITPTLFSECSISFWILDGVSSDSYIAMDGDLLLLFGIRQIYQKAWMGFIDEHAASFIIKSQYYLCLFSGNVAMLCPSIKLDLKLNSPNTMLQNLRLKMHLFFMFVTF